MLHGDHRLFEESRCKSWSRISCLESKTLTACTFPQDLLLCDTSLESPCCKSRRHPCHALPLPPGSPSSEKLQSKWRKGRLLGRGTFGHVYEGFNRQHNFLPLFDFTAFLLGFNTSEMQKIWRQWEKKLQLLGYWCNLML